MEEDIKYAEMIIKELETYNDLDGVDDIRPLKSVLEHLIKSYKGQQKEIIRLVNTLESQAELEKKDKIIDLMSEEIDETDRGYNDYCNTKTECDENCKKCIKQYFEKKVREENE